MQNNLLIWEPKSYDQPFHLEKDSLTAEWVSEVKEVGPFERLVVSWNSTTHENTNIEVWIRVRTSQNWSMWFSYGKWTTDGNNTGSFSGQKDNFARLDIDELVVHSGPGDAVQVKLALTRKHAEVMSPTVKSVYASLSTPANRHESAVGTEDIHLVVPTRSQLVVEEIGNIICSPTSISMVFEYYGLDLPTEQVAKGTIDNGTSIYGNWSYNVAYAGECGYNAYVEYCDSFDNVISLLKQGIPVVASIRTKDVSELEGATQAYPSGHLIVVTGIEHSDRGMMVCVNDPATRSIENVSRKYRYDQFIKAWKHLIYVIKRPSYAIDS
jgi:hypothetical protein